MKVSVKIHKSYRSLIAIADIDLLGKKFEEDIKQLDVRENFYKGEELEEAEVIKIIQEQNREDATFNIIGKNSVEIAIKAGLITEESTSKVQNIPYALKLL